MPISFKQKRWSLPGDPLPTGLPNPAPDPDLIASLAQALRLPPLIAALLPQRGLADPAAAAAFLSPQFKALHDPQLLPNIHPAVQRIATAITAKQPIVLFGDYDVDGITGTAILYRLLTAAGAQVSSYIPHRVDEGYGLSVPAITALIDSGAQLIITIDCGISAHEPAAYAASRHVDLIITDHHEIPPTLPPAHSIIHPRVPVLSTQNSALSTPYPNPDLCGAGVAFKLAWALATHLCHGDRVTPVYRDLLLEFTALAALATIADVVPLIGENRILVKYGLAHLPRSSLPGIQALIASAGFATTAIPSSANATRKIDATAVGFSLAPRLNAAGRMDHADLAFELLTTSDLPRAQEIAAFLETQNLDRQATEKRMLLDAQTQLATLIPPGTPLPPILVVHSPNHHPGVVGIVASRLVDQYHRPAFVLAHKPTPGHDPTDPRCDHKGALPDPQCPSDLEPQMQNAESPIEDPASQLHGSARSIPGFDLHLAIEHARPFLISGGGHAMAGGVKLLYSNLQPFINALCQYALAHLTPEHFIPTLPVDAPITLADCSFPTVRLLDSFAPFGRGNPHPRFILQRVKVTAPPRPVGATGSHLQLQFSQNGHAARGIAFQTGPLAPHLHVGLELDLIVEPKIDTWNGKEKLDLIIVDLARSDAQPFPPYLAGELARRGAAAES